MPRQAYLSMAGPTPQGVDLRVAGGLQRLESPQILSFGVSSHSFDVDLIKPMNAPVSIHRLIFNKVASGLKNIGLLP